ncbi:MMPL family transporter, partial [Streptomyces lydicus]|uniref:MMPL family transporter n=1 Tax=Streptomyces lydicus TaxID=47763 RepID=UPI003321DE95
MTALARWCLRRRIVVIVLWLAAFAGVAVAAGVSGAAYSNDYEVPGTESGQAGALMAKAFPGQSGDSDTIVWHTERGTVRAGAVEKTMRRTLGEVARLPGVAEVHGPYGRHAKTDAGGAQGARQISRDGRTAYAAVVFDRPTEELGVAQVRKVVETARAANGDGLQVELGGAGIALTEAPRAQLPEMIGLGAAAVVLFLAFGSLAATFLPIVTAVAAVGTASAGIALLSHAMTVADFAPMLGSLIGLGVGIDYALFIVTRHRKGLRAGLPVQEAAERAVSVSGRAVVFAGATVCIALLGKLSRSTSIPS